MGHGGKRAGAGRKKGTRNRPVFVLSPEEAKPGGKCTPAQRHQQMKRAVALAVHDGMAPEKIASIMGIELTRLQSLFAHELEHGREIVRLAELQRLDRASDAGNVTAAKAVLAASGDAPAPRDPCGKADKGKTNAVMLQLLNGGRK